ncbi:DsbA family protein [bacterium]|nr:DsbA family protein [bacterium]
MRIKKLHQEYNIELSYTLFPLHPYIPDEGITIKELFKDRNIDIEGAQKQLKVLMEKEGLEYGLRSMTYNSRLAQELAKWADLQPGGQSIHDVLYRTYFVEGHNLADIEILVSIAGSLQLDEREARDVLENRRFSASIDADWQRCRQLKIVAVPTYLCKEKKLVGAQTFEALEKLVVSRGAVRK